MSSQQTREKFETYQLTEIEFRLSNFYQVCKSGSASLITKRVDSHQSNVYVRLQNHANENQLQKPNFKFRRLPMADSGMLNLILWVLMSFLGWIISGFLCFFYIIFQPCWAFIEAMDPCMKTLEKLCRLPYIWAKKGKERKPLSDCSLA